MNNLEIKPISDLLKQSFWIPSYQRGYRWTPQEVTDLLDDIHDFQSNSIAEETDFYCLQPLVVKEKINQKIKESVVKSICDISVVENNDFFEEAKKILQTNAKWEVIDGQQRLTTIFLILKYLESDNPYTLEYETRTESCGGVSASDFLSNINTNEYKDHCYDSIDFHHFHEAFKAISTWFEDGNHKNLRTAFHDTLLNKVCFIWYKSEGEDAIKVFTRLNVGKISLTNAELIKALFLNKSNFKDTDKETLLTQQGKIASQWDTIEYTLQNDEFWLFIHPVGYERPTRIDFIFDIIYQQDRLNIGKDKCGNDDDQTFRYFNKYFKSKDKGTEIEKVEECWKQTINIFRILKEWYDDVALYHYVGYVLDCRIKNLPELFKDWEESKDRFAFTEYLKAAIKEHLKKCYNSELGLKDTVYEAENGFGPKFKCRDILLLHNIQTVIAQNNELKNGGQYSHGVFYKFPFHLYKKESWDIEHIDSSTENPLENAKDQKEWIKYSMIGLPKEEKEEKKFLSKVTKFLKKKKNEIRQEDFDDLRTEIIKRLPKSDTTWKDPINDKNRIWNYVLLDSSTNRGYGNSIFPAKRRVIIGKDRGVRYQVDPETLEVLPKPEVEKNMSDLLSKGILQEKESAELEELRKKYAAIAFIPPCTKNAFMKYYNTEPNDLLSWGPEDAKAYLDNILVLLNDFLEDDKQTNQSSPEANIMGNA